MNHVRNQCTSQSVEGTMFFIITGTCHSNDAIAQFNLHLRMEFSAEFPFWSFDVDSVAANCDLNTGRNLNWSSSYSGHYFPSLTKRSKLLRRLRPLYELCGQS